MAGEASKIKAAAALIALGILVAMLINLATSISFISSTSISPTSPDTTDNLVCNWNASADATDINVTWTNGSMNLSENVTGSNYHLLNASYTARGHNWYCNVTITNSTGSSASSRSNVTIVNAVPSIPYMQNASGNISNTTEVYEDTPNNFTLYSTDPDGDRVTYINLDPLPGGATLGATTGVFEWTPTQASTNTTIEFIARDNQTPSGISSTGKQVLFNVVYVNDAPQFSPSLSNQTINETNAFSYNIAASDEEGNEPLNFSIISVTPATISLKLNMTSNTTGVIMITNGILDNISAAYGTAGNYTVNVNVTDSLNASTNMTFILQINTTNRNPVLRNTTQANSWPQGTALSVLFYADDEDANQTINFSVEQYNCDDYIGIWDNITTNITNNITSTNATGNLTIGNLTNQHVVCRYINITVRDDRGDEDSEVVFLNITNTNDPPIVQVLSSHLNNTGGNNISAQSAYANAPYKYFVNATDIDQLTYAGDTLTYSNDGASMFTIDSSTGEISFTPNSSQVGNHTINITVTDGEANDTEMLNLTILVNTAPSIQPLSNITCYEDIACFVFINASDVDGDNLTFGSSNQTIFPITLNTSSDPRWNAYVNNTLTQSEIGNYTINITANDSKGATTSIIITVMVNNTNDAPVLIPFTPPLIVESHAAAFQVFATDQDYSLIPTYENVTFNVTNMTGELLFNISTEFNTTTNQTYGYIYFVPSIGKAGDYQYNVTATDTQGNYSNFLLNFTVEQKRDAPNISYIKPYLNLSDNTTVVYDYANASQWPSRQMYLTFTENRTVIFDINLTANATQGNLTYLWTVNGTNMSSNKSYARSYDFFSSGTEQLIVYVENSYFENVSFQWDLTITNVNRPPVLYNNFTNMNVSGTTTYNDYFTPIVTRFLDPDDDLNSDGNLTGAETSTLSYNATTCSVATITITGQDLEVAPTSIGTCTILYTATDSSDVSVSSNPILINATQVTEDETTIETPTSASSGGGTSRSSPIPIPITKNDLTPKAFEIITPEVITVYENDTVLVPILVRNNWNESLKGITINATSDSKEMTFNLSQTYIDELTTGASRNLTLTIGNYRLGEDYKIKVYANVTTPDADDSAYIYLNTIEQSQVGKDVQTKVTFAQDLLNDNPECLELNELLAEAKDQLAKGQKQEEVIHLVDGVIEGCKYLVSVSKKTVQKPETILEKAVRKEYRPYLISFLAIAGVLAMSLAGIKRRRAYLKKREADQQKEEKENEETAIKPYWPGG